MLRGLCKLTWIEIKIFLREPLGAIGGDRYPGAKVLRSTRKFTGPEISSFSATGLIRRRSQDRNIRTRSHRAEFCDPHAREKGLLLETLLSMRY
jgi:hypothetical protein